MPWNENDIELHEKIQELISLAIDMTKSTSCNVDDVIARINVGCLSIKTSVENDTDKQLTIALEDLANIKSTSMKLISHFLSKKSESLYAVKQYQTPGRIRFDADSDNSLPSLSEGELKNKGLASQIKKAPEIFIDGNKDQQKLKILL